SEANEYLNQIKYANFEIRDLNEKIEIQSLDDKSTVFNTIIMTIISELEDIYLNYDCFFDKKEIYISFYLESTSISNILLYPTDNILDFFKKKLHIDFIKYLIDEKSTSEKNLSLKIGEYFSKVEEEINHIIKPVDKKDIDGRLFDFNEQSPISCTRCSKEMKPQLNLRGESTRSHGITMQSSYSFMRLTPISAIENIKWGLFKGSKCENCGYVYCSQCLEKSSLLCPGCGKPLNLKAFREIESIYFDSHTKLKYLGDKLNLLLSILNLKKFKVKPEILNSLKLLSSEVTKISQIINFLKSSEKFLLDLCMKNLNVEFTKITKELFKKNGFYAFLDEKGFPWIEFIESKMRYPIKILSGGEKSKIIICLLSIIVDLSRGSSFYIIDEPNEFLDSANIEIIKNNFFKLFKNKQIVICTFIKEYENFYPAMSYYVWKSFNNVSHVFLLPNDIDKLEIYKTLDKIEYNIEETSKNKKLLETKAALLLDLNKYNEALETIDIFFEEGIKTPEAYFLKARALFFMNHLSKALEVINKGIKSFPYLSHLYDEKNQYLDFYGDYEKSLNFYKESAKLDEKISLQDRSKLLIIQKEYAKALNCINKAIKEKSNDLLNYEVRAIILTQMERFEEALEDIDKVIDILPQNKEGLTSIKVRILQRHAIFVANKDEKEKGIQIIKKAIDLEPEWASGSFNVFGEILMMFEDYEQALEKFEKVKGLSFTPIKTYLNMGKCLIKLKKYEEALKSLMTGNYQARLQVERIESTKKVRRIENASPQLKMIEETEKLILEIKNIIMDPKKIAFIDIETTGLSTGHDLILEIGIIELNLETGEKKILFDSLVRELKFDKKYKDSWVFKNSDMNFNDVENAPLLSEFRIELQTLFYKYDITAYNKAFDINFLERRGFILPFTLPDPMLIAKDIIKLPSSRNKKVYKWPSRGEAWSYFFPNRKYFEKNRAADDARHEAEILYEMYKNSLYNITRLSKKY
ncbi:hypothetical protein LCGC14_1569540, partial [marine sediment metagenome]